MIFSMICLLISFCAFIVSTIVFVRRSLRIRSYSDMCGIGCLVRRTEHSKNPFDDNIIYEYEVVDKKFDKGGKCWVKLHRPSDKDLTCFDKTKRIEELYDMGYVIVYPKK